MRRPLRPRRAAVRVERLEDRSLPSFLAAPSVHVGPSGGAGSDPQAVVTGDFNGDGKLDAATANAGADGVSVLFGTGTGGFKPAANIPLGRSPVGLLATDVTGDGRLDLVTANQDDSSVTVLRGTGLGFTIVGTFPAGPGPVSAAAGDFNGDGHPDLAVADYGTTLPFVTGHTVTVLFGTGTGKFTPGPTLAVGTNPTSVAVGDFDGVNGPDIAVVSSNSADLNLNLNVLLNAGTGSFAAAVNYHTGFCGNTVVVGDFNHDTKPDLAVACVFPSNDGVSILLGTGTGTFPTYTNADAGGQTPRGLAVGDFDGDGNPDIVTANDQFANNSVSLLPGDSNGAFGPAAVYTAGEGTVGVAVGDFNGDGAADVVTADAGTPVGSGGPVGTVSMLLGNGDGTLVAAPDLAVADLPLTLAATDFTGDGIPDLAVLTWGVSFSGLTVFPGVGDGTFRPRVLTTANVNPLSSMTVGDVNGDGRPDAVITGSGGVSVLLGNLGGTFSFASAPATGGRPAWVAIGQFTNDTLADLAVATNVGVSVLAGTGDGTFGSATFVPAGGEASYVAAADLNGDGKQDLAVINPQTATGGGNTMTVLLGQGAGTFTLSKTYPTRVKPGSVSVADFNHDGRPDLVVPTFFGTSTTSTVELFQNAGAGKFTLKGEYPTDSLPTGSLTTDFNNDGKADFAVATQFADTVFVFNGTGLGTFGKPAKYVVGDRPTWVASADFNGDGLPDLAVANSNSGTVTLLETPLPVSRFDVNVLPPTVKAGKAVTAVVTARDAVGHLVPNFTGQVSLTSTDPKAALPLPFTFTPAAAGAHRFAVTVRTAGSQDIVAHAGALSGTGTVAVTAAAATHLVVSCPTSATAGTPFDLTVTAADPFGNPDPAFRGTIHFTATDTTAGVALPADYTFDGADAGRHTFPAGVTLIKAGAKSVTATATGVHLAVPKAAAAVKVTAGALSRFLVSGFPAAVGVNTAHTFKVTAQDAFGNTVTNYTGTVQFTSSDPLAVLPPAYTFAAANLGQHSFTARLLTPGVQWLSVDDGGIIGEVTGITVT